MSWFKNAIAVIGLGWLDFRQRLLKGVLWNLVSTLSLQGSMLITGALVARIIGIEDFGIYALMMSTLMTLTGVAQGSSGIVATKFVAEGLADQPQRVAGVLRMCAVATAASGICCASLLWATAPIIADELLHKPVVEPYLRLVAFAVVFQVLIAYQHGALQGFGAFKRLGIASSMVGLLHLVVSVLGAAISGLEGAVQGLVVAAIGRALIAHFALRQTLAEYGIQRASKVNRDELHMVWSFALPSTLAGFVTLPCIWAVTLMVARQPNGLAWIALFSVAHQIKQAVLQLPAMLNVVAFSALSRAKGQGDAKSFRKIFLSSLTVSFVFVAFIALIISALAPEVLSLFGSNFVEGVGLLRILLLAAVLETIASFVYQLVQSRGLMWHSFFIIALPRDVGYLALVAIGLTIWGLMGAGLAYLFTQVIGLMLTIFLLHLTRTRFGPLSC
jgi:O-antigen/teichoic acid export membrane protein